MEVDQQAYPVSREFQVSQYDSFVNWCNVLDSLQFNNDSTLDKDVDPIAALKFHVFVDDWNWFLTFMGDAPDCEFFAQALFIGGFEEARAQEAVDLDGSAYDPVRQGCVWV